jgi:PIN domain nuclease of toxin-antitoxin system
MPVSTEGKLLLDTHTFLWASFAPQKLSAKAREWLMDGRTALYLSVASLWEIEVKHEAGQLQAEAKVVDASLRTLGVKPIAITAGHLRTAAGLGKSRGSDPFDWMIAAQAMVEGLPVVTEDAGFGRFAGLEVRW